MRQIKIRGARTHNLQSVDVDLPRDKLIVITGLSGSGKSSLAFDTIYAEGQRRYVESLSAYARQFLSLMEKPDVDLIEGLSPAISIEQKATSHNPRSTVGTVTEIYDYLRTQENRPLYRPSHTYIARQDDINEKMRAILIDWLIDVHLKFKLVPETLFMTFGLVDRYLEREQTTRSRLQLVGATALFLAAKYEETEAMPASDFVWISDDAFTCGAVLRVQGQQL